jgi:hypothetical protein
MLYTDQDLLEAARTIRSELPDLLDSETAQSLDDRLAKLLNQVPLDLRDLHYETISAIVTQVEESLKTPESTKTWLKSFLIDSSNHQRQSFEPLPGNASYVATDKYICPHGDYRWSRRSIGQPIPRCPTHNVLLIPIAEFQQLRSSSSQENP